MAATDAERSMTPPEERPAGRLETQQRGAAGARLAVSTARRRDP